MHHVLVRRRDVAAGGVVISAEVRRDATTLRGVQKKRQVYLAAAIDDRLRGFDHHLELQTAGCQSRFTFQTFEQRSEGRDLLRNRDLRQGHHEIRWQAAVVFVEQRGNEDVECAKAA